MKYATLLTVCFLVFCDGCTRRTVSNTSRTALEQLNQIGQTAPAAEGGEQIAPPPQETGQTQLGV